MIANSAPYDTREIGVAILGSYLESWHGCDSTYSRAFRDGLRNFEQWSSGKDDTPKLPPPSLTSTPHQWEDV
ncbi:hypothetical protein TNCV_3059551 [Trichonephila clavipes]|nr:hypothetical protein TNCV_3059551 [Trichonephila clavipes]